MNKLFEIEETPINTQAVNNKTCKDCKYRERFALNQYSPKVIQCCVKKHSKLSNSGYKTIKTTDVACVMFENE